MEEKLANILYEMAQSFEKDVAVKMIENELKQYQGDAVQVKNVTFEQLKTLK